MPDDYALPFTLDFLWDSDACFRLIETVRWAGGAKHCPRCQSSYTRNVNTSVFRELFRCIDCGYMFNTLSGTIFQGTKLPLPKFFQLFTLYNVFGSALSAREVSYLLDVSQKTASVMIAKTEELKIALPFAASDATIAAHLRAHRVHPDMPNDYRDFFFHCDSKDVVVSRSRFIAYLAEAISWERADLPVVPKRIRPR